MRILRGDFTSGSIRVRLMLWNVAILAVVLGATGLLLRSRLQSSMEANIDRELTRRSRPLERMWPPHDDRDPSATPIDLVRRFHEQHQGPPPDRAGMQRFGARPGQPDGPPPDDSPGSSPGGQPPPQEQGPPHGGGPHGGLREFAHFLGRGPGDSRDSVQDDDVSPPRVFARSGEPYVAGETPWDAAALKQSGQQNRPLWTTVVPGPGRLPVRVHTVPLQDRAGAYDATLQEAISLRGVLEAVARLTRSLLTIAPVALLLAALGAAFLTDRALRPVRAVTRAASLIEATDMSGRLTVTGNDEFSRLAETFNGMLERLEGAFTRLENAYEMQRRFIADASHELRTPLTVIKANTSLTLGEPDLARDYRDVLEEVDSATDRTIRIVQDLLFLARSDGGQLPLVLNDLSLGRLLSRVVAESRWLRPDAPPVRLVLPDGADALVVRGDNHHLMRLFTNLVDNALRHTLPTGSVTLAAAASDDTITVEVIDTGEGIAPEHLPHLGERFYRVDSARARAGGGTGLGLAISRAIAEAHDGELALRSTLGQGTTVSITLPRSTAAPTDGVTE